jgi:regulator of protease activity HflC (stomatin/prohibitin superfamily)
LGIKNYQNKEDILEIRVREWILRRVAPTFRFDLSQERETELEAGNLSDDLREEFKDQGIMLPPGATLSEVRTHSQWQIKAADRLYVVSKEFVDLSVFSTENGSRFIGMVRAWVVAYLTWITAVLAFIGFGLLDAITWNWARDTILAVLCIVPFIFAVLWMKRAFRVIGAGAGLEPSWAVIGRFGRPIEAVRPGLYVRPWWLFEQIIRFPTGQKMMAFHTENAYTRQGDGYATQPAAVDFVVYTQWPDPKEVYHWPTGLTEGEDIEEVSGEELLKRAFFALPRALRNPDVPDFSDRLMRFIEGGAIGAVRMQIAKETHEKVREGNEEIEKHAKRYALLERGNPCRELGWPLENFDIEISRLQLPIGTEGALRAGEIARLEGEAKVQTAQQEAQAAPYEAQRMRVLAQAEADRIAMLTPVEEERAKKLGEVYRDLPDMTAFILAGGGGAKQEGGGNAPTINDYANIMIARSIGDMARQDRRRRR